MIAKITKIAALGMAFLLMAGASAYLTLTFIIKSEDTVIVPNLVGKDVVSALELLTDLQLNTKVNGSEYSRQFPKNHVTFQEPDAGSEIKKDRDVRIILSRGHKNFLMPNLITLSAQQARMIMEENGISNKQLSFTYSNSVEKDHVIAQIPSAGDTITRGVPVNLLMSVGPRPARFVMPDLSELSLDESVLKIEKNHLAVGEIRSHFDKQKPRNIIVDQEPLAGYRVNANSPVNLTINRPPGKSARGHLRRPLYGSLIQHRSKNGFLKKRIRVELEGVDKTAVIFDNYIKPGDEIWVLIPRDEDATVFIYEDDELVSTQRYDAW